MAGYDKTFGSIKDYAVSDDKIWSLFNYVFSDSSKKRNTYKFGLIKSLLDNAFNGKKTEKGVYYTYEEIFSKFAENYWNLVVKYDLRQMRPDGKSKYSRIESIFIKAVTDNTIISVLEFQSLDIDLKKSLIKQVSKECRKYVIGALYEDFDGLIYDFDLADDGLTLNPVFSDFMLKYKSELERLNYYSWAKFLEQVNDENVLIKVLEKLELATPKREDLSIYRELLRREFEENTCFYCGKKLNDKAHVDHFIPWSFVKDDKIWNFVLACPSCNSKKNNKIPKKEYIVKIEKRNNCIKTSHDIIIETEMSEYSDDVIERMWKYAMLSGYKEYQQ